MVEISERLRSAAKEGSELRLKALLREPGCDALAQDASSWAALMWAAFKGHEGCVEILLPTSDALTPDKDGWTALMLAACCGHEGCVRLLLPVSDALAQDGTGKTASAWARKGGHKSLAQWIDAYARAQSERADLGVAADPGAPCGRAALRV